MSKIINIFTILLLTFCIITTLATNQPDYCTSTLSLLTEVPLIGHDVSLKLRSDNAPTILTSYNVILYQNGVVVRNVSNVGFTIIDLNPVFEYTFTGVTITDAHTVFWADMVVNFIIIPLVFIRSNNLTVDARFPTSSLNDATIGSGTGIINNSGLLRLGTRLFVTPQVPLNQPGPTDFNNPNDKHTCATYVDDVLFQTTTTAIFIRSLDNDFEGNCELGFLQGTHAHIEVTFPGDDLYGPSAVFLDFDIKTTGSYTPSDITISYPPSNYALTTESSLPRTASVSKGENARRRAKKDKNDRRRRSLAALE